MAENTNWSRRRLSFREAINLAIKVGIMKETTPVGEVVLHLVDGRELHFESNYDDEESNAFT